MTAPSGKFILRVSPVLHAELRSAAAKAGLSLNEYCALRLASGPLDAAPQFDHGIGVAITKAREIHHDELAAVVLYGSVARGTATRTSDVDLLVVLRQGAAIRRQMYRAWDELDLTVQGLKVEPAIVALPADSRTVSGFWAEIATQGLICWWKDLSVHRYLTAVREKIASGVLRRERSHGQTYWVHKSEVA